MKKLLFTAFFTFCSVILPATASAAWQAQSPMAKARSEASAITVGSQVYVFNGFGPNVVIEPSIEKYNPGSQTWSLVAGTSVGQGTAVTHNGIVAVGSEVWLIGGRIGNHPGPVTSNVWIYNTANGSWRKGPQLPIPGAGGGAALVNNSIHWFGGLDPQANCDVNRHYKLNLANQAAGWQNITSVAAMPNPRNHFSTVVLNGQIYALGGQFGHDACPGKAANNSALAHVFNPQSNSWSSIANLPGVQSHAEPSTFAHGGFIYFVGGQSAGNKVWRYQPSNNQWTTITTLPQPLLAPVARIFNGRLVIGGGGAPTTAIPTNQSWSMAIGQSSTPAPQPQPEPQPQPQPQPQPEPQAPAAPEPEPFNGTPVTLVAEAENHDDISSSSSHSWIGSSLPDASAGSSMITSPDNGAISSGSGNSPMLGYFFNFTETGTYHVWIRGWGDAGVGGQNNSLHAGLNGNLIPSADNIDGFPPGWSWSKSTRDGGSATLNIDSTGIKTVNLWMREDGLAVDKILLTNDPSFVPSGMGPGAFDGSPDDGTTTISNAPSGPTTSGSTISISGNTLSWPNDGWYQVLSADNFAAVCNGGTSCQVQPGRYIVINHSTSQRFENIVVAGNTSVPTSPQQANNGSSNQGSSSTVVVNDRTISWPDDGWYQVLDASNFSEACAGGTSCSVSDGTYIVINHTTGQRFENIRVPALGNANAGGSSGGASGSSPVTVNGTTLSWPDDGWYQVQSLPDYNSVCNGGRSCNVGPGTYVVINHSTGQRYENIRVGN